MPITKIIIYEKIDNAENFEKAYNNYRTLVHRYIFARIRDKGEAQNLTQEVFLKAWKSRKLYNNEKSSLKNWLFVIAVNITRDYFRKQKIKTEELYDEIESKEDIEKTLMQKNLVAFVFKQIENLSEKEQDVLLLRYHNDLSVKEISKIMEMSYSATKVTFHRAIKKLQTLCKNL